MSAEFGNLNLKSSEGMYRGVRVFYFHKNVHIPVQYGLLHILRGPHKKVELSTPPNNRAIIQTGSDVACLLLSLLLTHGRGNPLVLTLVLFIAHWLYKKENKVDQLAQFSSVKLMLS